MSKKVLIIGYGNSLRSDDGVGRYVADRLSSDARLTGATVIGVHQLMPELVVDIGRADLVVFVDAGRAPIAGAFTIAPVERSEHARQSWSHHFDPAALLALADELYGASPDALVVAIGVGSVEVGDHLSPAVEAALPRLIDSIVDLAVGRTADRAEAARSHA